MLTEAPRANPSPARRRGHGDGDGGSGGSGGGDDDESVGSTARTSEVRDLLQRQARRGDGDRSKPSLSQVRIETFKGSRAHYKEWKRAAGPGTCHAGVSQHGWWGSCHPQPDGNQWDEREPGGLARILRLLEESFGSRADERFEEKQEAYLAFRRQPGMSIGAYIGTLKRLRTEYLKEDEHTVISDKSFAQRLLTRAGLTRRERMDIFFSSGGKYATAPIERVIRFRCSNIHQEEGRGSSSSKGNRLVEDRGHTSKPRKQMYVKRGDRKHTRSTRHQTALAGRDEPNDEYDDEEDPEDTDNEDLEQEALAAGGGGGSNDEGEEFEDVPVEDEWDDEEWNTVENLKDAYAAGWRPKQQSAEQRKGRGYRGQSKGKGKGSRPKETRQVDDRKKNSRCSSCKQKGHWHGDPECPNVQSGKDAPREPGTGGSSANYNTSGEGDARGSGGDSVRSHRVNWTFMEGWELLRGYASELGGSAKAASNLESAAPIQSSVEDGAGSTGCRDWWWGYSTPTQEEGAQGSASWTEAANGQGQQEARAEPDGDWAESPWDVADPAAHDEGREEAPV